MKKLLISSLLLLHSSFFFKTTNAETLEVTLNCSPTYEMMFGTKDCIFGCKQKNDWEAISISIYPNVDKLSVDGLENITFSRNGNRVNFDLLGNRGHIKWLYQLDTVTGALEVSLKGKPAEPKFYRDMDATGFATIQKNFFYCEKTKKLF